MGEPKIYDGQEISKEKYLLLEEVSEQKHEFWSGRVRAQAGGSFNHQMLVGELYLKLRAQLDPKGCTVFMSDMKVNVDQADAYLYPDVSAVCGPVEFPEGRDDIITNPSLIVEVLSPSTSGFDFAEKFDRYKQLPSLQEYVLVSQHTPRIEVRERTEDWGHFRVYTQLSDVIHLNSVDVILSVEQLYARVRL